MSIEAITVSRSLVATSSRSRWLSWAAIALKARASGMNSAGSRLRATRADESPSPNRLAMPVMTSIGLMMSFSAPISAPSSTNRQTNPNCR